MAGLPSFVCGISDVMHGIVVGCLYLLRHENHFPGAGVQIPLGDWLNEPEENPFREAALAEEAKFFATMTAEVFGVSVSEVETALESPVTAAELFRSMDAEEARQRLDVMRRRQQLQSAYRYSLIRRRTNASAPRRRTVTRPRERRAGHGRTRRTSTTRDDGPAEPPRPALAVWGSA